MKLSSRLWSNMELKKFTDKITGSVVNVSAGSDKDKYGLKYQQYFNKAKSYTTTNFKLRGKELKLDLTQPAPENLIKKFDVVFNHSTLEHVENYKLAFKNLCDISKDMVILVVPAVHVKHTSDTFGDYTRFPESLVQELFKENNYRIGYISSTPPKYQYKTEKQSIFVFAIAQRIETFNEEFYGK